MKHRGGVAQLVEQRTHKPRVPRSIRGTATKSLGSSVAYDSAAHSSSMPSHDFRFPGTVGIGVKASTFSGASITSGYCFLSDFVGSFTSAFSNAENFFDRLCRYEVAQMRVASHQGRPTVPEQAGDRSLRHACYGRPAGCSQAAHPGRLCL